MDVVYDWVVPWVQNRLILGRMSRWKSIYLMHSYDQMWAMLQSLQQITQPQSPIVPPVMTVQGQDGISYLANGNWSARELCKVVRARGNLNAYVNAPNEFVITRSYTLGTVTGHSVELLDDFLRNVVNGNWAGPPGQQNPGAEYGVFYEPPRPLSLRGLLAGAAA
jgi:hypothetical protein